MGKVLIKITKKLSKITKNSPAMLLYIPRIVQEAMDFGNEKMLVELIVIQNEDNSLVLEIRKQEI